MKKMIDLTLYLTTCNPQQNHELRKSGDKLHNI